ncbi:MULTISPECIES: lipid-A-disaccharide synthase [Bacteroidaceae]|uniref:Lipid-A-disaccharide synthase n=1 Tax=Phocaeicola intestinalis TaxID=2762212 RepID=A0ABR8YB12_9BACT|nr:MULTISPECIES: lipid-A-disaccharide synthase [Bacteroidaceae]CCZ70668.1 lipid-A-disaccharide synthase [Bacteroides sp. CAG:702]MBD8041322.1 lipid-A-disaccharide synthase [Phocaeicola intestinalis]MBM6658052.1 lipid-A-disaccharide synthase [Bacteroides gallinaceum]MBM6945411.1 lipid-A-disaccharide synthase [Bacteroides gallinaceum]MDN0065224.1 lipid-A-disaccharide synthase [Bacteroides gallinaceum]
MKYYLIVGEASGDLHASNLMRALLQEDPKAEFRFFGGDLMKEVGGTCVRHYKSLAYMGFIPVLLHLRTILRNMEFCKNDVEAWNPDVLILVDYPGFNLKIAQYIKLHTEIPIFYYISPKIWAWKEYRIKNIQHDVDAMFSILPFEVEFYQRYHFPVHYVGNPCVDAVDAFRKNFNETFETFVSAHNWEQKPIIALLAGSRKQEIKDNLRRMIKASRYFPDYQFVVAGAPGIEADFYRRYMDADTKIVFGETYRLLSHATAALVTSGTATLETALFRTPQVVCYYTAAGKLVSLLRRMILKVPFVSLVNLIAGKEVVTELVAGDMQVKAIKQELSYILPGSERRKRMLENYDCLIQILGKAGASGRAARQMLQALSAYKKRLYQ